jgi:Abnormal spindle-like microcephaly-assoc'd, ASPM-SPD-2-Hydin
MNCLGSPLRLTYRIFLIFSLFSIAATAQMALSVQSVNFGSVPIGSSLIVPMKVTNSGKSNVTISQVTISGTGFAFVGPNLPIILPSRQTIGLSVSFTPQASASVSGSVWVSCSGSWGGHNAAHSGSASATLSGTGAGSAYLTAPLSMNLGSLQVGSSQTQTLTVSNTGGSSLSISAATIAGSGFTMAGLTLPYNLAAGASANLYVTFSPTTSGTDNATLTLVSNASDPSVSIALTGSATNSSGALAVTPASMSFGSVTIGTTQTQNGSITANGGSVTLSSTSSNNSAFTIGGLTLPVTLAAGQSVPFSVSYAPTTSGVVSANISFFTSNSGSASETANGSGATIQHTVGLSWNASTSASIAGYNIYRGTSASGPYSRINSALDASLTYSDSTVQSGQSYYYATTAVDSAGGESSYSNQVQVVVPFP